jgi:hypothetical protein
LQLRLSGRGGVLAHTRSKGDRELTVKGGRVGKTAGRAGAGRAVWGRP